jgi:hypothetical protein
MLIFSICFIIAVYCLLKARDEFTVTAYIVKIYFQGNLIIESNYLFNRPDADALLHYQREVCCKDLVECDLRSYVFATPYYAISWEYIGESCRNFMTHYLGKKNN